MRVIVGPRDLENSNKIIVVCKHCGAVSEIEPRDVRFGMGNFLPYNYYECLSCKLAVVLRKKDMPKRFKYCLKHR